MGDGADIARMEEEQLERQCCPDTGACHHECAERYNGACWRVFNASPLTIAGFGDRWPREVLIEHTDRIADAAMIKPSIEDAIVGNAATDEDDLERLRRELEDADADERDAASRASAIRQEIADMGYDPEDF